MADIRHDSFFRKGNNCSEGGKYSGANVKSRIALTSRATFAFQIRDSPGVVTADVAVVSPSCRRGVAVAEIDEFKERQTKADPTRDTSAV